MSARKKLMTMFAKDMLFFGKFLRPKTFEVDSPKFHRTIAAHLSLPDKFPKLNIIAPRGFAKTTLTAFIYVMWHIFVEDFAMGRQKTPKFVVLVSKSRPHSVNLLEAIKNCLEFSVNFKRFFGYWGEHSARQWKEGFVKLKDGTVIDCRGMGQQVRGMNIDGRRPTLVVLDDAEDEENTKTDEALMKNQKWFEGALEPMIKKTYPKGRIVNIGTPQHQNCLVFMLKNSKRFKTLHFSALMEKENGEEISLWPEMWPVKDLHALRDDMKENGRMSNFYREYMCQVVGDTDSLVTSKDLRFWDGSIFKQHDMGRWMLDVTEMGPFPGNKLEKQHKIPVMVFMGVDPASSISNQADFSVIMILAVDSDGNRYVLDYYRDRVKPMTLAHKIIEYYEIWHPERTRIESVGYQEMIRDYLRTEYSGYIPGIEIKHNPRNSKSRRLESLQPLFAAGKVYLKEKHKELMDELLLYPRAKHDDTLDGLYYASLRSYGPTEHATETELHRIDSELKHFMPAKAAGYDPETDWLLA